MRKKLLWCGLIGFVICVIAIAFVLTRPLLDSDEDAFRSMTTHSNLSLIGGSIEFWKGQHKRAPTDEENFSVLEMTTNTPPDGWGRPLVYKNLEVIGHGKFLLYSLGPNGIDENGSGDDVVYRSK